MTTISFYHLLSTSRERALPKLMEKAISAGNRVVILSSIEAQLKAMSDALWSVDPNSFLPHGMKRDGHASEQPIYLSLIEENPNNADVLCVLDGSTPTTLRDYAKMLDIFDGNNEDDVLAARARWKHYKEQGLALQYVKQQPGGGWKIEMTSEVSAA